MHRPQQERCTFHVSHAERCAVGVSSPSCGSCEGMFVTVSMAVSTVSVIESIIVMRICCIQTRKMPAVVRFVAFRVIGRALCINRSPTLSCKPRRDSGEKIEFQANDDAKESLLCESTKPNVARNGSELVDKINDVLVELRKVRLALFRFILAVSSFVVVVF